MNSLLRMQKAAKAKHFKKGIYYKILPSLSVDSEDGIEAGQPFNYKLITDEKKLAYLGTHISIHQNEVVLETYAPLDLVIKAKIKLDTGRILQVKNFLPVEEVVSSMSIIRKWTITLG